MQTGGAGRDNREVGPLKAKPHGHMACNHVDDGRGHKERRDTARPPARVLGVRALNHGQAANAGTDDATDAHSGFFVQGVTHGLARVHHSLVGGCNAVVNEGIHRPRFFGGDVRLQVEPFDFACDLAREVGWVKPGDEVNAGLAGKNIGPGFRHRVTHGADAAQTGHDNATSAH